MAITLIRRTGCRGGKLLLRLMFAVMIAAGWIAAGYGAVQAQTLNSSGNYNIKFSVDPIRKKEGYSTVLYDIRNGLPTSEANAIAQTEEGFIWIGSYAGLIRYDGTCFERIDSTEGIANVRCLYVDSSGRLWVGTNDSGVFLMSQGGFIKWDRSFGLPSVSIRVIAEDTNGIVYVGTTAGIISFDSELNMTILEDERIASQTVRELRAGHDGLIYGLTLEGDLFTLKEGSVHSFLGHEQCKIKGILSLLPDPKHPGRLYLGTDTSVIYNGSMGNNFAAMTIHSAAPLNYIERFEYFSGQLWICAGNGIGVLDVDGFHELKSCPMNTSVGHVMTDYEGNLWFTSTRQGIMKIVQNQFSDLFDRYDLPPAVVNATCLYGRKLFMGTDTGLIVIDNEERVEKIPLKKVVTASGKPIDTTELLDTTDLLAFLDGVRIRYIMEDSKGRLWIATWRKYGLLCYEDGVVTAFTTNDGLFSEQIRTACECEDGSIVVANTGGVSIIQEDRVAGAYGEKDGITVPEILTVTEGYNNELILGSDGGGIYITGPEGIKHIGTEDGLKSDVVMRIKRSRYYNVYWIVTSNSLAVMTPDYQVRTIEQFPYPNNYDLYENAHSEIWVLSSTGIFVTRAQELLVNGEIEPVFYGIYNGLPYISTANSYSELTSGGDLYMSSTLGVVKVNIEKPFKDISEVKVSLPFVDADDVRIYPDNEGSFFVPGYVKKLTVYPFVFNYSLINPQVSYSLEGFDSKTTSVSRNELTPIDYTNLPVGNYQFNMVVTDPVGGMDKMVTFQIVKGKKASAGTIGSILIDIVSVFFMAGILAYTALYRKRGRTDDKLFFAMVMVNMVLAVADCAAYYLEGNTTPLVREAMIGANIVFYTCFALFACLFILYLDYDIHGSTARLRKIMWPAAIPCLLLVLALILNLKKGWIFSIGKDCIYHPGPWNNMVFIPTALYLLLGLVLVYAINKRLIILGVLLIGVRIALGFWFREISSTAFIYTLFLVSTHLHVMYQPLNEEAI